MRLARHYQAAHVATGDIFRTNVAQGTPLGRTAKRYIDSGDLVPDEVVIAMVMDRLASPDCEPGFLLDGFPRTVAQAEALDSKLARMRRPLDAVLCFEAAEDELFRRLAGRSAELGRSDDSEETIRHRLEVYATKTRPLVDYYMHRGLLNMVDAVGHVEEISARILELLRTTVTRLRHGEVHGHGHRRDRGDPAGGSNAAAAS